MKNNLANRLKLARKSFDMSKSNFSIFLGCSMKTYEKWEYGTRVPDINMIIHISKKLKVTVEWLVGTSDDIVLRDPSEELIKGVLQLLHKDK